MTDKTDDGMSLMQRFNSEVRSIDPKIDSAPSYSKEREIVRSAISIISELEQRLVTALNDLQDIREKADLFRSAYNTACDFYDSMKMERDAALARIGEPESKEVTEQGPPADCSGDPASCPDNDGRGCFCQLRALVELVENNHASHAEEG